MSDDYARPSATTDVVVFRRGPAGLEVLLITRGKAPFEGMQALPGGFVEVGDAVVDQGEDLPDAAARELREETGLVIDPDRLRPVGFYGAPYRDPRARVLTATFFVLLTEHHAVGAGDDASDARFVPIADVGALAFDHRRMLVDALERADEALRTLDGAIELLPQDTRLDDAAAWAACVRAARRG
jgi:8-oxo-dGTP diphosphatase